ncbi:glycosyltransferase [Cellulomonas xiejunii]|uniref:Glycosyltransferase n=1 Tax=Cellulomonas xiejunii TaxID=2968083 RepID=A0ABY5KPJ7_9CELL|nr:glycosyltransferase [Cellulomonas xiejunii]MCC2322122.1 glycosyltransferase [Cellulomonas xiejunii]MCC2323235.1 glycosyltransferase [Cellulomonas xiejunii]UUI72179.1 glycosyltransferase [Cellulomonas xiejunii]
MGPSLVRDADRRPRLDHLLRLATPTGLYEHALGDEPRVEHGMCVDDVARALVVTARFPSSDARAADLAATCLRFVRAAQHPDGRLHNRRHPEGAWLDEPSTDDHWGRGLWALAVAAVELPAGPMARGAHRGATLAMAARSPHTRATAYAALGAAELLRVDPRSGPARRLLGDARATLPRPTTDARWPWPEPRLTYANAVLPEALIAVGGALGDDALLADGLRLLDWLVAEQTVDGRLSVVPVGGRGPGDDRQGFDQQPVEVTALAEAAATALRATGDPRWVTVLDRCVAWFEGANDAGVPVRDPATGAGFDGLERDGVNQNRGAESTLAWLACAQLLAATAGHAA